MKTRRLGQEGLSVGCVGYGGMSLTDFYGPTSESDSFRVLDACVDLGVTHIDTANVYGMGHSESLIGNWLKRRGGENPFVIATKAGIARDSERRLNNDSEHLESSLNESLTRLGIDSVDLFYVHRRDVTHEIEAVTDTLSGFIESGKVRMIGFSEIAPSSLRRAHAVHPVSAVQSEYSLSTRYPELGLVQACEELGVTLVAFSPVGRSLLTNTPHSDSEKISSMSWVSTNPRFLEPNLAANLSYNRKFCELASDLGVAAASLAIAWLLHRGEHILPIPGTRSVDHLREAVAGSELNLSPSDLSRIDEVLPVGWAHGDRYSVAQWSGPERYC